MNNYTNAAMIKIFNLVQRGDCNREIFIGEHFTVIEFEKQFCVVDTIGVITWDGKNE